MTTTYAQLLKDPRWQRKRLEVMERADFTCEVCNRRDLTLHVHHSRYENGRPPWDVPDDALHCICEVCHEGIHEGTCLYALMPSLMALVTVERTARLTGLNLKDRSALAGHVRAVIQWLESIRTPFPCHCSTHEARRRAQA